MSAGIIVASDSHCIWPSTLSVLLRPPQHRLHPHQWEGMGEGKVVEMAAASSADGSHQVRLLALALLCVLPRTLLRFLAL
eukprot:69666-Pleurochrysis_carterae.AAC.1